MSILQALFLATICVVTAQECRSYMNCLDCLEDPHCGWCGDVNVCVLGSPSGPSHGSCSVWDFYHCPSPPPNSGSWTTFGGSATHNSFRPITLTNSKPTLLWRASYGSTVSSWSIVAGGRVYAATPFSSQVYLVGIDILNGTVASKTLLGKFWSYSAPSASDDFSLIAVQTIGPSEGIFTYVFNTKTGTVSWVGSGSSQWANYPYGPLITPDNNLYYLSGEYNGQLKAYYGNGTSLFDTTLYNSGFGCDTSTPAAWSGSENIYWTTSPGEGSNAMFGAISGKTGAAIFSVSLNATWSGYSTRTVPVIADSGIALVTSRTNSLVITAISLKTRAKLWTAQCSKPASLDYTPATDNKIVALVCADNLMIYDLTSGEALRKMACVSCTGQPILTTSHIIVSSNSGVVMIDRSSGQSTVIASESGTLTLAGYVLIITQPNGAVVAYTLKKGSLDL